MACLITYNPDGYINLRSMKGHLMVLKNILLAILLCMGPICSPAQVSNTLPWTYMKGDSTSNNNGSYGALGTPGPTNRPGGREGCGQNWTDASGNLWLFGSSGYGSSGSSGLLNDLWKYDPATNYWTWISGDNSINNNGVYGTLGTASLLNKPGGRALSTTWTDNSGNFWLFGGVGYTTAGSFGYLNDLWKYDIASNQWTWVSGDNTVNNYGNYGTRGAASATNKPGGRARANRPDTRTDASGNLWLFGGTGMAAATTGDLNDLWKFNTVTNQWTWMSGDNFPNGSGIYGTMGTPAAANKSAARVGGLCWIDTAGKFWLNGGSGTASNWAPKYSDLWKYDPLTNNWTWMKGNNTVDQYGVYGTKGTAAATNNPGGRLMGECWFDNYYNFWIFGGYGYSAVGTGNSTGTQGLSDLWKYDPLTNNWTWMKGDSLPTITSVYGTQGVADPANKPSERSGGIQWKDGYGNLWQFGGLEWAASGTVYKNDLWKLVIPQPVAKGNLVSCQALTAITINSSNNNQWVGIYDNIGNVAAEINANGNNLGTITTSLFTKTGGCREDGSHRLYLNRNITITPQNQPSTAVSVRFYVLKAELDSLKHAYNSQGQPSGVASINEVDVFKNSDACSAVGNSNALPFSATNGTYNSDYYLQVNTGSFSTFYFANKVLTSILPVKIISFSAKRSGQTNTLNWEATCNGTNNFIVERSSDGIHFAAIGTIAATIAECNLPFNFADQKPLAGDNYYRLRIDETGFAAAYSNIILLEEQQAANVQLSLPEGNMANSTISIQADAKKTGPVELRITDIAGRILQRQLINMSAGINRVSIKTNTLAKGIYFLYAVANAERTSVLRFVKL